jgi:type IV secretion system protein TrbJ
MDLFWRRSRLGLFGASAITLLAVSSPSHAQLGTCTTIDGPCSSFLEQQISYALQGVQELHEAETALQEDINTFKLPLTLFQDASGDIANLVGTVKQADLLIGNTGQFIANLSASSYPTGSFSTVAAGEAEIVKEQNAIALAIKQLGTAIDVENPLLAPRATILAALNNQSLSAQGRLQALQSAQAVGATTGQQLQSMTNILMAIAQGQHATMLSQADRRAMEDKALDIGSQYTDDTQNGAGF